MSRIGKSPIHLPKGVKVEHHGVDVKITGPNGTLHHTLPEGVDVKIENENLIVTRKDESRQVRSLHGLTRSILNNIVKGVTHKYKKELQIIGVGYKAQMRGKSILNLSLGFSHPIDFILPEGISAAVDQNTKISIEGCDKHMVGEVAAQLRGLRPPEPYKGKGVRYINEHVRKKAGKAVAAGGAAK